MAQSAQIKFCDTTGSSVVLWYFPHQVPSVSEGWQSWICGIPIIWYDQKGIVRYFESGSTAGYFGSCCAGWNGICRYQLHACLAAVNTGLSLWVVSPDRTLVVLSKKEEGDLWWCVMWCLNLYNCCLSVIEGMLDFTAWSLVSCEIPVQLYEEPKLSSNHFTYMQQLFLPFHNFQNTLSFKIMDLLWLLIQKKPAAFFCLKRSYLANRQSVLIHCLGKVKVAIKTATIPAQVFWKNLYNLLLSF